MSEDIGIPIKVDKTVYPTTTLTFLGLEIDTFTKKRKKVTLKELQSLIGLLNFACAVVKTGRAFLRRLIDLTIGLRSPGHR